MQQLPLSYCTAVASNTKLQNQKGKNVEKNQQYQYYTVQMCKTDDSQAGFRKTRIF